MSFQLSESLYPVDEVIGTFTQCLLMKSTIDECLFWLWELIYTSPNICDGLLSIYQQFYSHTNANMGVYITRKTKDYYATGDNRHLADIVNNLLSSSSSPTAYYIVKYSQIYDTPSVIYKHMPWMDIYPRHMHCLVGALKSRDTKHIGVYTALSIKTNGFSNTKDVITQYAENNNRNIDTGITEVYCVDDIITLSCLIAKLITNKDEPKKKFTRANIEVVMKMDTHFSKKSFRSSDKLKEMRLYPTHAFMPPASYGRFTLISGIAETCSLYWEYYCFNSIEWNMRFNAFGAELDHNKKRITWKSIDGEEQFYDAGHCLEIDEQSGKVMEMSLHPIDVFKDPKEWYEEIILNQLSRLII